MVFRIRLIQGEQFLRICKPCSSNDQDLLGRTRKLRTEWVCGCFQQVQASDHQFLPSLHALSHRFEVDSAQLTTPTASDRITQRPFSTLVQSRWNQQVDVLFKSVTEWDRRAAAWVRQVLYGGDVASKEDPVRK